MGTKALLAALIVSALPLNLAHAQSETDLYAALSNGSAVCNSAIVAMRQHALAGDAMHARAMTNLVTLGKLAEAKSDLPTLKAALNTTITDSSNYSRFITAHIDMIGKVGTTCRNGNADRFASTATLGWVDQRTQIEQANSSSRALLLKVEAATQ
jgi:hypothetical protein